MDDITSTPLHQLLEQGNARAGEGDREGARACYDAALEADPNHVVALHNLAAMAFEDGRIRDAVVLWHRAFDLNRQQFDTLATSAAYGLIESAPAEDVERFVQLALNIQKGQSAMEEMLLRFSRPAEPEPAPVVKDRLHVGFVTIWFERGQAYVTKAFRDALAQTCETFVFARTGGVYGQPKLETGGTWDVPNLTTHPTYDIPPERLAAWIRENALDVVIFNEEYDWRLVMAAKETGVKVITYLDYLKDEWRPYMSVYDAVLCSTLRSYDMVKDHCPAYYVGWGVDTDLFKPSELEPQYTFFHNAGWLGINYRKMTPAAILAFDAVAQVLPEVSLFVHAQVGMERLPPEVVEIVHRNPRITYHVETVTAPGLYHKGRILLFPTKLEGLGLPLIEGMSCGMPAIATDAAPMNEFVYPGYNGLLVRVGRTQRRQDDISFPETLVDVNDLAAKMALLARNTRLYEQMASTARRHVEQNHNLKLFAERVGTTVTEICTPVEAVATGGDGEIAASARW